MKKQLLILGLFLFCVLDFAFAQTDFEKYKQEQQQKLGAYQKENQENFKRYKDSLNQKYAEYLAKQWENFNLIKSEPPIKTPIPNPPVFDNETPKPEPTEIPIIEPKPTPKPKPMDEPKPIEKPQPPPPVDKFPLKTVFFGTNIELKDINKPSVRLSGVSEKDVANYWKALATLPQVYEWMDELLRVRNNLQLNEWGSYQLLNKLFSVYFPQGNKMKKLFFRFSCSINLVIALKSDVLTMNLYH
jgi:hypothetical protein